MGISPYYRGSACNFWAIYDNKPQFMGATIHHLSKGLDNGKILFHALPKTKKYKNNFDFTMNSVLAAQKILVKKINNKSIFKIKPIKQDKFKEIRYSKNQEFNNKTIINFLKKNKKFKKPKYNLNDYINPCFDI